MKANDRTQTQTAPRQLEQRSVRMAPDDSLDQYSADGWELVTVIPDPRDPGMVLTYFKRRR